MHFNKGDRMLDWKRNNTKQEVFERQGENGVPFLSFKALEDTNMVKHGFSTRLGGVSSGDFSSMNLSISKPDKEENVKENFKRISKAIGIDINSLCLAYQVHSTNVKLVTSADRGYGINRERPYNDVDGLVTNSTDVSLVTFYADCIPLFLLDTKNKAIALSHSGWRGTVNKMAKVSLNKMQKEFNTRPVDVIACIGPGICKDCYEVSSDVYNEFKAKFYEANLQEILTTNDSGRYQLDLLKANKFILLDAGFKEENIHISDICTHCNSQYLFSHRAQGDRRGNLAAFFALK